MVGGFCYCCVLTTSYSHHRPFSPLQYLLTCLSSPSPVHAAPAFSHPSSCSTGHCSSHISRMLRKKLVARAFRFHGWHTTSGLTITKPRTFLLPPLLSVSIYYHLIFPFEPQLPPLHQPPPTPCPCSQISLSSTVHTHPFPSRNDHPLPFPSLLPARLRESVRTETKKQEITRPGKKW